MKWKELLSVVSFLLIPIVAALGWELWFYIQDMQSAGTPLDKHPQRGWQLPQNRTFDHGHNIQRDANGMRPTLRLGKHIWYTRWEIQIYLGMVYQMEKPFMHTLQRNLKKQIFQLKP